MLDERLKKVEEELAYLRKQIEEQNELIKNMKVENHSHIHYEYKNSFLKPHEEDNNFLN